MKTEQILSILSFAAIGSAHPVKREVPQEHSHQRFLTSVQTSLLANNPDQIQDAVFGLLGDAAASAGKGNIADVACLHQATADQAFTNAKAAGDITGMTNALVYAALERNTAKVGQVSAPCTSVKAVNPEIAALSAHQDPASANAAATNKQITLTLAQQIASIGGDVMEAINSGTFAPGDPNDNTGKGNSCDDQNDSVGCIFTQNLLVADATADEINAAVAGGATATGDGTASASGTTASDGSASASGTAVGTGTAAASNSSSAAGDASSSCDAAPAAAASSASSGAASASGTTSTSSGAGAVSSSGTASGSSTSGVAASGANDFGTCVNADPTIKFADGLDGRKEAAFAPNDNSNFNHGSALNIKVIADFICQQLNDKCKASDSTVSNCQSAATSAEAQTEQQAADTFNAAFQ